MIINLQLIIVIEFEQTGNDEDVDVLAADVNDDKADDCKLDDELVVLE